VPPSASSKTATASSSSSNRTNAPKTDCEEVAYNRVRRLAWVLAQLRGTDPPKEPGRKLAFAVSVFSPTPQAVSSPMLGFTYEIAFARSRR
jgi:hypothetical protein